MPPVDVFSWRKLVLWSMAKREAKNQIPVIDVFAGPGGLGEGFSACLRQRSRHAFRICLSIEKEHHAHRTLRLRSFVRQFAGRETPEDYYAFVQGDLTEAELFARHPDEAGAAKAEAWNAELGSSPFPHAQVAERIRSALRGAETWALIGGPPCQAYSVAGRSRNKAKAGYRLENDNRHRLYQEYLRIVAEHEPPVFVMENVKGLLSATVRNELLFERMHADLCDPAGSAGRRRGHRYRVLSLEEREDPGLFDRDNVSRFVVRMERHGIPQCRHRVILLGIRDDLGDVVPGILEQTEPVPARRVLHGLPRLRSGLSRTTDSPSAWFDTLQDASTRRWLDGTRQKDGGPEVRKLILRTLDKLTLPRQDRGGEVVFGAISVDYEENWFLDERLGGACNHETRTHMAKDLHRYLFAACFARVNHRSPTLADFPPDLLPNHKNVEDALNGGLFNDRFRVQLAGRPATTITSHLHKDGHYYIHYDPSQCRSLTVREAARLQTFPDNYFFTGPRTQQYIQVGNAVPPLLARQTANIVLDVLRQAGMTD